MNKMNKMNITKMKDLPAIDMNCNSCNKDFMATVYSRAFSYSYEFLCDECGVMLDISIYDPAVNYLKEKYELFPSYDPDEFATKISEYLVNCSCGGSFSKYSGYNYKYYRCPHCKELLPEKQIVQVFGLEKPNSAGPLTESHIEINGETIEYTNPGLETVGHVDTKSVEFWLSNDENEWLEVLKNRQ